MRFLDLVLFTAATSITIRWLPTAAGVGPVSLLMWGLAMAGFMAPLIIATCELAVRFPGEGGLYAWAREVLGPFWGFLCGWLYWTCNLPFFSGLLVFILNALAIAAGPRLGAILSRPELVLAMSLLITFGVTGLHVAGVGAGKWASNLGSAAMFILLALLLVAGAAVALTRGPATDLAHASWRPPLDVDGAIVWSVMVFALAGPESLAFLSEELGGARRIVRILASIGLLQVITYGAGTLAMLAILTPAQNSRLSGVPDALARSLLDLGAPGLTPVALLLLCLAFVGGFSAWFGVAARVPFAAGVDAFLPRAFGWRHPRTGAPVVALLVQGVATALLVLIGQGGANLKAAYDFLVAMTVLSYTLPFLILFAIYWKVQDRPPPGGGWTHPHVARLLGAAGFLVAATAVLCTLAPSPDATDKIGAVTKLVVACGVLIASGVILYAIAGRHRRRLRYA
jgi:amino acid transporter